MLVEYKGKKRAIGLSLLIIPTAAVIADVEIKDRESL
jgi:hypothetical protein